jgi:pyruvate/2-oxoacid:ferredoxin oxidoreductase alpha subunit
MSTDPWTDPDPQPGDFDADLAKLDPRYVERNEGDPDAKLIVLVGVEGEDAKRLERLSEARGKNAGAVVSELLREAERSAA